MPAKQSLISKCLEMIFKLQSRCTSNIKVQDQGGAALQVDQILWDLAWVLVTFAPRIKRKECGY